MLKIADKYNLSTENIVAAEHSAGGHLATWLAARENISPDSKLYVQNPLPVRRLVSLAGINDLERYTEFGPSPCGDQMVEKLVSLDYRSDEAYSDTSPVNLIPFSAEHIGVVAVYDRPVPPFLGREFSMAVAKAGGVTELILHTEAGHYEMTAPWTKEWQQILQFFKKVSAVWAK